MRKIFRRFWLPTAFLLLGGCAQLPKDLPHNPIRGQDLALARPAGMPRAPWLRTDWWQAAKNPALNGLVTKSLARNPDLHAAAARVLLAQAQVAGAHSRLLPHFDAGLEFTQQYFSAQGLHLSANGTSNFYAELDPLLIHYHVDLWGKDRDLVRAARGRLTMAQAEAAQTRLLLSTAVVLHYFALRGDERLLQEEERMRIWQKRALQVAAAGFASGIEDASSVHGKSFALARSAQRIAALKDAIAAERHALAALTGQGPAAHIAQAEVVHQLQLPPMGLPPQLPLNLLGHRPDIVAARWAVRAAAADVGAAQAAFYPDINLRLLSGWNSIHIGDLFDPGNFAHALGPAVSLPIFEGGALRARLKAQNALFLAAQDYYQSTILRALRQVADVLSSWQKLARENRAEAAARQAESAQWRLRRVAWKSGLEAKLPSIEAQIALLQIAERQTAITTARLQNWALLESALGGGYRFKRSLSKEDKNKHG